MDIDALYEYAIIVKHMNLSSAAKELHTTQPLLSKHLATLEEEVGAHLFVRGHDPMELTPAGVQLHRDANIVVCKYYQLIENVRRTEKAEFSVLKIGGSLITHAYDYLLEIQKNYRQSGANTILKIAAISDLRHRLTPFDLIREGAFDLVLEPISSLVRSTCLHDLEYRSLYKEPAVIVVEPSHRLASLESVSVFQLENEVQVTLASNYFYATRKHAQSMCLAHGFSGILAPRRLESFESLFLQGLGEDIMILPQSMIGFMGQQLLKGYAVIPVEEPDTVFDMCVFYRKHPDESVRQFLDLLQKVSENVSMDDS